MYTFQFIRPLFFNNNLSLSLSLTLLERDLFLFFGSCPLIEHQQTSLLYKLTYFSPCLLTMSPFLLVLTYVCLYVYFNCTLSASFLYFFFKCSILKSCQLMDSNPGHLAPEATVVSIVPQPLPMPDCFCLFNLCLHVSFFLSLFLFAQI